MNWYRLIKFADAKSKIQRFGIADPYKIMFLYKYENLVDWSKVSNLESFDEQIYDLTQRILNYPESLDSGEKKENMHGWGKIITSWGSEQNNAKIFLFIKPIFDYSMAHKQDLIPSYEALKAVESMIENNPTSPINILKEYIKNLSILPKEDGWHRFSISKEEAQNADIVSQKVKELSSFVQGSGWCISDPKYANQYLHTNGKKVHILIDGGKPEVAIVTKNTYGTGEWVSELRGPFNKDPDSKYYKEIKNEAIKNKIVKESLNNHSFDVMGVAYRIREKILSHLNEPSFWVRSLKNAANKFGIGFYDKLSTDVRDVPSVIGEFAKIAIKQIKDNVYYFDTLPNKIKNLIPKKAVSESINLKLESPVISWYEDLISFIGRIKDEEIIQQIDKEKLTNYVKKRLQSGTLSAFNLPNNIFDLIDKKIIIENVLRNDANILSFLYNTSDSIKNSKMYSLLMSPEFAERIRIKERELFTKYPGRFFNYAKPGNERRAKFLAENDDLVSKYVNRVVNSLKNGFTKIVDVNQRENHDFVSIRWNIERTRRKVHIIPQEKKQDLENQLKTVFSYNDQVQKLFEFYCNRFVDIR